MKEFSRIHQVHSSAAEFMPYGHYVIDEEVLRLCDTTAKWPDKGKGNLPFETTAIEYVGNHISIFIFARSDCTDIYTVSACIWNSGAVAHLFHNVIVKLLRNENEEVYAVSISNGEWEFESKPHYDLDSDFKGRARNNVAGIFQRFLYLRNVNGIGEERVEAPAKLNKKRLASGKPAIQPYIRLVVGQVYDRDGNEIPEHERRHVRPHIRAGHSRRQHHGPKNSLIKTVHIPSTVVNYGSGDILPDRPRVFVLPKEPRREPGETLH